jgi:hypothetical protein
MNARRTGLFALGLLAIFLVAVGIGSAVEPADTESGAGGHGMGAEAHGAAEPHADAPDPHTAHGASEDPAGLAVSESGYTLRLDPTFFGRNESRVLRFAIADERGEAVTRFDELHERRMHLIVVRRDGTGFRHLHPEMDAGGTWAIPIELAEPGAYRAYADFSVAGEQHTLATDLFVSGGEFTARPFPAPAPLASTDGYEVRLRAEGPAAGQPAALRFAVAENGEPVEDLAPYLGAMGHLVALREGDLAYLHVHPEEGTSFAATFPTAGRYRLYLQFKHAGAVRTAEFTLEVPR